MRKPCLNKRIKSPRKSEYYWNTIVYFIFTLSKFCSSFMFVFSIYLFANALIWYLLQNNNKEKNTPYIGINKRCQGTTCPNSFVTVAECLLIIITSWRFKGYLPAHHQWEQYSVNTTDRNLWAALSERRLPPLRVSPSASRQTGQPQRTDGKQEEYLPDTSGLLS